mmetsp:Transcript_43247/g.112313  ORF Transcript_43247/g.112313 Transcript_43247/m.112313 type:complete len:203 (-) Transcript_43247:503-1111(-)
MVVSFFFAAPEGWKRKLGKVERQEHFRLHGGLGPPEKRKGEKWQNLLWSLQVREGGANTSHCARHRGCRRSREYPSPNRPEKETKRRKKGARRGKCEKNREKPASGRWTLCLSPTSLFLLFSLSSPPQLLHHVVLRSTRRKDTREGFLWRTNGWVRSPLKSFSFCSCRFLCCFCHVLGWILHRLCRPVNPVKSGKGQGIASR